MIRNFRLAGIFLSLLSVSLTLIAQLPLKPGAERSEVYASLLLGKSLGVVANNASLAAGINVVDGLLQEGFQVQRIFSPEHGFRTSEEAGQNITDIRDSVTGLPVVSLYGKKKKPSPIDMKGIDLMIFDLQDVGVRFYTYISTLTYVMEACAENNIPLIVFDRPNPNGFFIDGPLLDKKFSSFIGLHPVPVVYGMTIGEYARMVNGEGWLKMHIHCDLTIIPLEGYTHPTRINDLTKPSPNLTCMNAILLYPSLCFFEGTIISVGRGTYHPFEVFGHPDFITGSYTFIPISIPGMSLHPPFENQVCHGTNLQMVTDNNQEIAGQINLFWLISAYKILGNRPDFFSSYFDQLAGTDVLRNQIIQGMSEAEIKKTWQDDLVRFKTIRKKYLLYPD